METTELHNFTIDDTSEAREMRLWKQYQESRDHRIRDTLVEQYAPLVKYVAGKVAVNLPSSVEYDDLVGYGVFGLFDAIEKFDPCKHVKFKTYAVTRIRGAAVTIICGKWTGCPVRCVKKRRR